MAELTHFYTEENTVQTTTSGTYVDIGSTTRILGTDLSGSTKYLIVARAMFNTDSATDKGYFRVEAPDDVLLAAISPPGGKSESIVEFERTSGGPLMAYLFSHSFVTRATPSDVNLQFRVDGSSTMRADQMSLFLLDLDAISAPNLIAKYFFDASDAGPTDSGNVWANDANAFDGSLATSANKTGSTGDLSGEGTTAPTTGAAIGFVAVRVHHTTLNQGAVTIEEDNVGGTVLGSLTDVPGSGTPIHEINLTPPSGGWTWQKINDLAISFSSSSSVGNVFLAEVLVYDSNGRGYFEDIQEDTSDEYAVDPSTTDLAQLLGSDLGTDEYWILGSAQTEIGSTGRWFEVAIESAYDTSTAAIRQRHRAEGEDTDERRIMGWSIRHKASSGTPNVTLLGMEESGNANMDDGGAYLIALPTSLFADFEHDYIAGVIDIVSETTVASVGPYTPSVNGNHLILGSVQCDIGTSVVKLHLEDGTTETRPGDVTPSQNQVWDFAKDREMVFTFERISISAQKTYNLRGKTVSGNKDVENRWLIVVNLNKPAVAGAVYPPFPRPSPRRVRM